MVDLPPFDEPLRIVDLPTVHDPFPHAPVYSTATYRTDHSAEIWDLHDFMRERDGGSAWMELYTSLRIEVRQKHAISSNHVSRLSLLLGILIHTCPF